jgi:hypothetical protein
MAAHGKSVCRLQGKATCGTRFRKNVSGPGKEESEKEESGKTKIGKRNRYETEDQGYSGGDGLFSV